MANAVINALFTAQETISDALQSAERSMESLDASVDSMNGAFLNAKRYINEGEQQLDEFRQASLEARENSRELGRQVSSVSDKFVELSQSENITERQMEEFTSSVHQANQASSAAEESLEELVQSLFEVNSATDLSDAQINALRRSVSRFGQSTYGAQAGVDSINQAMFTMLGAAKAADNSVERLGDGIASLGGKAMAASVPQEYLALQLDDVGDQADDASRSVKSLTGDLAILNTVATTSAFKFSSLSVNIGPFNLALRNILTQLPAILTGMSTMLALVTALASAFITLGVVSGALIAGGAIAFFEDFSKQFEESAEAAEALMGALRDLFMEALAPITENEANMDLFINFIDGAAALVNRFAQFVEEMRGDVLDFIDTIDVDVDGIFEAMHDSFMIMRPILRGFIEFFLNEFPDIIVRFSELSRTISDDIAMMLGAFGELIYQLLDFASVVLNVIAPAVIAIVGVLTAVFAILNSFPDGLLNIILTLGLFAAAIGFVTVKLASLAKTMKLVHSKLMIEGAGSAGLLGAAYETLHAQTLKVLAGQQSLIGALSMVRATIWAGIGSWFKYTASVMGSYLATNALSTSMIRQSLIMSKLFKGNMSLITALKLTAYNMGVLTSSIKASILAKWADIKATGVLTYAYHALKNSIIGTIIAALAYIPKAIYASIATYGLAASLGLAAISAAALAASLYAIFPILLVIIGAFLTLAALMMKFPEFAPFAFMIDQAKNLLGLIKNIIGALGIIPGMGMNVGDMDVANVDDIQTDSNVDLSFEESINNNVDVQADPEEKAQISRITKDALQEANSLARRQQGSQ